MGIPEHHIGEALAILCGIFWAAAICLFKKSGETIPPMSLNLLKNTLGIGFFFLTMLVLGQQLFIEAPAIDYLLVIASGVIGMTVADTLFLSSLNKIGASLWGLVDCLYTPSVIVLAFIIIGERLEWSDILGASLIISAILVASVSRRELSRAGGGGMASGIIEGIASIVLMAVGGVMMKVVLIHQQPLLWMAQLRLIAGTVGLVIVALCRRDTRAVFARMRPGRQWKNVAWGAFLGPYMTILLWIAGMKYTQVSVAAILNQLSVLFIFLFAGLFLRERITPRRLVALAVALAGAMLVVGL
ncbi:MAG: DMT family transporter [Candidatus Coatesbacteria bacterium]|nr:DMT family transporter [Candidatus Coatesbacteria bacterium]